MSMIVIDGIYRHYKGNLYKVLGVVKHSETLEDMVLYECLYENEESMHWVRPLRMFTEEVHLGTKTVPRFEYIGYQKGNVQI